MSRYHRTFWLVAQGWPATLYHGTNKTFDSFDLTFAGKRDWGDWGLGVYLSPKPLLAAMYAEEAVKSAGGEAVVYMVKANLSNTTDDHELLESIQAIGIPEEKDTTVTDGRQTRPETDSKAIAEHMIGRGFDSAKARSGSEIVVYDTSKLSIKEEISLEEAVGL
jgi:ADP-Ribosyltransferase in polyvalent proteins